MATSWPPPLYPYSDTPDGLDPEPNEIIHADIINSIVEKMISGEGAASSPIIEAGDFGVSSTNSATVNGAAMRAICTTNGGKHIRMPLGVIDIDTVVGSSYSANPLNGVGSDYAAFWLSSGTWLEIPTGCEIRFMGPSNVKGTPAVIPSGVHRIISNKNMGGEGGGDEGIRVFGGGTLNGNTQALLAGNAGGAGFGYFAGTSDANRRIAGMSWWRASNLSMEGITIQDCHGENGSGGECFHLDFIRCLNVHVDSVTIKKSFSVGTMGQVATGFSNTYCMNLHYNNCVAIGMDVQGFTTYGSRHVTFEQCWASRNKRGFNFEYSWDITMTDCVAGGFGPRFPKATSGSASGNPDMSDSDNTFGNRESGYHIIFGDGGTNGNGGGRYRFLNCSASGQLDTNAKGFSFGSGHTFTCAAGTTGSTIVTSDSNLVSRALVGGYAQVVPSGNGGTSRLCRITAVSGSTITTEVAHGGTSGQKFLYYPGEIVLDGCLISENYRGITFLGSPGASVQAASRSLRIVNCDFQGNTNNDIQDHAKSDTTAASVARFQRGVNVTTSVTAPLDGTAFMNPFPFDVDLRLSGATEVLTGGRYSDPAAMTPYPMAGPPVGGVTSLVRTTDTGALTGTTLVTDSVLTSKISSIRNVACDFEIFGQIMYTGDATNDVQWQLIVTPDVSSSLNQASRHTFQAVTATGSTQAVTSLDSYGSSSGTTPLTLAAPVVAGAHATTRWLYEFRQRVNIPGATGGRSATWALQYAEAAAGTGINVRAGSWVSIRPMGEGYVGDTPSAGSSTNAVVRVPAGGWISVKASSAAWIVA